MERMTRKINGQYLCRIDKETEIEVERDVDFVETTTNPQINVVTGDWYAKSSIIDRLGEFEDFMEEQGFEDLEYLKATLKKCEDKYFKMQRDYKELQHCIWKDTPIEQIRNNYKKGHNFDFVGVAYNRGKAKIDRKVRQENQALKDFNSRLQNINIELLNQKQILLDRWHKLKELLEEDMEHNSKEYDESFLPAFQNYSATENWVLDRMEELEKE